MSSFIMRHIAVVASVAVIAAVAGGTSRLEAQSAGATVAAPSGSLTAPVRALDVEAATTAPVGPRLAPAGFDRRLTADAEQPLAPQQDRNLGAGANVALMGVGAAAVVIGLLIGGDGGTLVAISGGVIGLYGLFRFLR
jgi:hypothetical protein